MPKYTIPADIPEYILAYLRQSARAYNPTASQEDLDADLAYDIARRGWQAWEEDASLWADDTGWIGADGRPRDE